MLLSWLAIVFTLCEVVVTYNVQYARSTTLQRERVLHAATVATAAGGPNRRRQLSKVKELNIANKRLSFVNRIKADLRRNNDDYLIVTSRPPYRRVANGAGPIDSGQRRPTTNNSGIKAQTFPIEKNSNKTGLKYLLLITGKDIFNTETMKSKAIPNVTSIIFTASGTQKDLNLQSKVAIRPDIRPNMTATVVTRTVTTAPTEVYSSAQTKLITVNKTNIVTSPVTVPVTTSNYILNSTTQSVTYEKSHEGMDIEDTKQPEPVPILPRVATDRSRVVTVNVTAVPMSTDLYFRAHSDDDANQTINMRAHVKGQKGRIIHYILDQKKKLITAVSNFDTTTVSTTSERVPLPEIAYYTVTTRRPTISTTHNPLTPHQSLPLHELDMLPAHGHRVESLRAKGHLCDRNVLVPEGPKYDARGFVILRERRGYNTRRPRLVLPRCCNCCKKSVLGCQ